MGTLRTFSLRCWTKKTCTLTPKNACYLLFLTVLLASLVSPSQKKHTLTKKQTCLTPFDSSPFFFLLYKLHPAKKKGALVTKLHFFLRVPTVFLVRVHFANIFPSFGLPKQKRPAQRTYMPLEQLLPQPLARLRHHFTAQALRSCAPSRHCQLHEGR